MVVVVVSQFLHPFSIALTYTAGGGLAGGWEQLIGPFRSLIHSPVHEIGFRDCSHNNAVIAAAAAPLPELTYLAE
jgi:hypothetical protein